MPAKKQSGMRSLVYISAQPFEIATTKAAGDITVNRSALLGGQRNATLNRSAETIDATSKDTEGNWMENIAGFKSWGVDMEAAYISDDAAYKVLEDAFLAGNNVYVLVIFGEPTASSVGNAMTGEVTITDFPIDLPYNDLVTYSLTLGGSGALKKGNVKTIVTSAVENPVVTAKVEKEVK